MAESAGRLCRANDVGILRLDGDVLRVVAHYGPIASPLGLEISVIRGSVGGRAVLDRRTVHVADVQAERNEFPESSALAGELGYRALLSVPLLREGVASGVIALRRTEVEPFTDKQIELLETFADQAVIAIENVRLFTELQEKNSALTRAHAQVTEALEQQTATSEILAVISSSPTDVEPVFRTILANANTLCGASFAVLWLWDGEALTAVAHENVSPALAEDLATARVRPHRRNPLGLTMLEQTVVHVADVLADPRFVPENVPTYRLEGARSILSVPMLREGTLVGVINIWRREPRVFTDSQIALVRTFADQALITIENVRLFTELQSSNSELSVSLDQQTATSEILRVISSSPTDAQPVFDAIAHSTVRLCEAARSTVWRPQGELFRCVARCAMTPAGDVVRVSTEDAVWDADSLPGRAVREGQILQVNDVPENSTVP